MSNQDFDRTISNGSCYWAAESPLDPRYIPCGNAALGHVPCCESGNTCLSSNACFDLFTYVTYLAGCSDETYQDKNCPDKGVYGNQSWVGLSNCANVGSPRAWVGCTNPEPIASQNPAIVYSVPPESCFCPVMSTPLFSDAQRLADYVTLPASTGGTVALGGGLSTNPYQSRFTSTSNQTTVNVSTTPQSTTSTSEPVPSASSTSSAPILPTDAPKTSNMPKGRVAGAAAGGTIGFLTLVVIFIALMQRYHRKKREASTLAIDEDKERPGSKVDSDGLPSEVAHGGPPTKSYKSELPADPVASPSTGYSRFSLMSEVEGSPMPAFSRQESLSKTTYHELPA